MTQSASSVTSLPKGTRPNLVSPIGTPVTAPAILVIGDSTSYGYTTGDADPGTLLPDAFRLSLHTMLTRGGMSPTWIGPQTRGTAPADHGLWTVGASLQDIITGGQPASVLATYDPDLVIIDMGLNDADDAVEAAAFAANLQSFVQAINTNRAGRRYVLCIPSIGGDATRQGRLTASIWPGVGTAYAALLGLGIACVVADLRSLTWQADQIKSEGLSAIHPRWFGYLKQADAMYPAVMNVCGLAAEW